MAKYYNCPTCNFDCPYFDTEEGMCAMEIVCGDSPAGECDEYDAYNDEDEEDEE